MVNCIKFYFLVCTVCSFSFTVFAQDECELKLTQALEEFNAGHFYVIPGLINECLKQKDSREWRQRAYLLLAETYLLLEDPIAAENSYLEVLKANPEFLTDRQRDPIDMVYLSSRFTAIPKVSVYAMAGFNMGITRIIHDVKLENESGKYSVKPGWQLRGGLDWNFNREISVGTELNYGVTSFIHTSSNQFGIDRDVNELSSQQTHVSIPVMIKYTDARGMYRPYGYVGFSQQYLLRDRGKVVSQNRNLIIDDDDIPGTLFNVETGEEINLNLIENRNRFTQYVLIGTGVKYKSNLNFFFLDIRYAAGLSNVIDPTKRYSANVFNWPVVDDDFRLDNLSIAVGFSKPFYNPRRVKTRRTIAVLRKIRKK
jgi:hypothetical protein